MYLQADTAFTTIAQLGELGIVQFKDLNANVNAFQRHHVNEIRRCEEMERQLKFFEKELKSNDVEPVELRAIPDVPPQKRMIDLEAQFESSETELREVNNNLETLEKNFTELTELQCVLRETDIFFQETQIRDVQMPIASTGAMEANVSDSDPNLIRCLTGVIPLTKLMTFHRLLWNVSRGNFFLRHVEIPTLMRDLGSGDLVQKVVFLVVCYGEALMKKLRKVAEGCHATLYPCPQVKEDRQRMLEEVAVRLTDLRTVLEKSKEQRTRCLHNISLHILDWDIKVLKLKACFQTLNLLHKEGTNYVAECWLPYAELANVQTVLDRSSELCGSQVPSILHPIKPDFLPTYNRVNKFTRAFQVIIDAYGVADYREVNPALFSIITFPFLFSVMFGDAGHGLLLLLFSLFLIIFEVRLKPHMDKSEIMNIIFSGRYLILMMGLFSIYSGLVYNDVFSKSLNIFGSKWIVVYDNKTLYSEKEWMMDPSNITVYKQVPYYFGVDPVWAMADNKITFTNSFKKKISVIFGVGQMLLGVMLSLLNHLYFRHYLSILTEFIPMLLFLLSIFGYLCALVFAKWGVYLAINNYYQCAPNILIGFINMFMFSYPKEGTTHCSNLTWYNGQQEVQSFLVVLAIFCALWLLLSKPLFLYLHDKRLRGRQRLVEDTENVNHHEGDHQLLYDQEAEGGGGGGSHSVNEVPEPVAPAPITSTAMSRSYYNLTAPVEHKEAFDFGDVFIHQAIHTIEFCLGCVSHTASYLRLWALSLAHAQLSEVLWSMVMHPAFSLSLPRALSVIMTFVVFCPFAVLTVVILLVMEGLSAFLHTLRLHWVEFNSKFYKGEGEPFEPFSFWEIMSRRDEF